MRKELTELDDVWLRLARHVAWGVVWAEGHLLLEPCTPVANEPSSYVLTSSPLLLSALTAAAAAATAATAAAAAAAAAATSSSHKQHQAIRAQLGDKNSSRWINARA